MLIRGVLVNMNIRLSEACLRKQACQDLAQSASRTHCLQSKHRTLPNFRHKFSHLRGWGRRVFQSKGKEGGTKKIFTTWEAFKGFDREPDSMSRKCCRGGGQQACKDFEQVQIVFPSQQSSKMLKCNMQVVFFSTEIKTFTTKTRANSTPFGSTPRSCSYFWHTSEEPNILLCQIFLSVLAFISWSDYFLVKTWQTRRDRSQPCTVCSLESRVQSLLVSAGFPRGDMLLSHIKCLLKTESFASVNNEKIAVKIWAFLVLKSHQKSPAIWFLDSTRGMWDAHAVQSKKADTWSANDKARKADPKF